MMKLLLLTIQLVVVAVSVEAQPLHVQLSKGLPLATSHHAQRGAVFASSSSSGSSGSATNSRLRGVRVRLLQNNDEEHDDEYDDFFTQTDDDDNIDDTTIDSAIDGVVIESQFANPNDNDKNNDKNNNNSPTAAPVIPDDEYHCDDPEDVWDAFRKDDSVNCDWDTHEWDLDALDPWNIPEHCQDESFQFRGNVQELRDWEEPCYLWEVTYGELKPSQAPSNQPTKKPTSKPSAEPTYSPSTEPINSPSQAPTVYDVISQDPTNAPSQSPTLPNKYEPLPRPNAVTAEEEDNTDTEAESTNSPQRTGPQVYDIATMVITYTLDPVDGGSGDRNNERLLCGTSNNNNDKQPQPQENSSPSTTNDQHYYANTDYMTTHHQDTQRLRRNLLTFNRNTLESVTAKHVRRELKRQLGFWLEQQQYQEQQQNDNQEEQEQYPLQVSVDLTMTSIRAFLLPNETVVATEAISGYVSVDGPPSVQWPISIKENIEQTFEDRALRRYTELLEESDDKALRNTKSIETGLPLDLLSSDGDGSKPSNSNTDKDAAALTNDPSDPDNDDDEEEEEGWTIAGFTISLTLLAIIAGAVALLSVALLICVWWRMRLFRKQAYDNDNNGPQAEDEEQPVEGQGRSRKSKQRSQQKTQKIKNNTNNNNSNKKKNVKQQSGSDTSPTNSDIDPASDPTMQKYFDRYVNDINDDDNGSVATSTYSYIDTNLQQINANASLAPSFMYGNDDVSLHSKTMWSLIDGITNDENYNYHDTASPAQPRNIDTEEEAMLQTPDRLMKSPSNMMISTAPKNFDADLNDDLNDDDDQISLMSYGYSNNRPSPDPIPMPGPLTTPKQPSALEEEQQQQQSSRTIEDVAATPNSQANTFIDNNSESQDSTDVKHLARQGVSARKKKNTTRTSTGIGSTATNSSVRKALGQLAACATSHKDKEDHGEDADITPAPSDEKSSPSSDVENQHNSRRSLSSSASSRAAGSTSALREVNQRLSGVDSSAEGSKNSSLYPGKLFDDTTLKSESSSYMVEQAKKNATATNASALDTSALMKDANGNYVIDSMASF